jgi:DNA-binding transcriptional LysR family regulator
MNIRQIELRLLEYFISVVDAGSIKSASNNLNISQPALSRLVNRLETELGVQLLDRGPRGVTLTRYGEIIYRNARVIAEQERNMRWELGALKGLEQGVASVGVGPYLGDYFLPSVIANLLRKRPGLHISIHSGSYPDLLRALLAGETDVFFSALPQDTSRDDVRFTIVRSSPQAVVARCGHPLMCGQHVTFARATGYFPPTRPIMNRSSFKLFSMKA